jgi:hypothetical protein
MMDAIDKMLTNFSNEIVIITWSNPKRFEVQFGAFPSQKTLSPLLRLFEPKRFEWDNNHDEHPEPLKTLTFSVNAVNVIPISDAISALTEVWTGMGYTVTRKHEGNDATKITLPFPVFNPPLYDSSNREITDLWAEPEH